MLSKLTLVEGQETIVSIQTLINKIELSDKLYFDFCACKSQFKTSKLCIGGLSTMHLILWLKLTNAKAIRTWCSHKLFLLSFTAIEDQGFLAGNWDDIKSASRGLWFWHQLKSLKCRCSNHSGKNDHPSFLPFCSLKIQTYLYVATSLKHGRRMKNEWYLTSVKTARIK